MNNFNYGMGIGGGLDFGHPWIFILIVWSLFWKGLALWHSGRRAQPWWFVIMLVINTAGLLEIIYLFGVAKLKFHELFKK